jgi:hypothetical protein
MMKIVYCTYDIDEMPIALRNTILEGTTVEKIYHSQVDLQMAKRYAKEDDTLFTYCKSGATHVMLPNGKVHPIDCGIDIDKEVADIDSYFNEDMKYTNDPLLGWIREDYLAKQTSYLVNEVDYDKLAEKIRKSREERAKVVRTELDLIEKLRNLEELRKVIVYDNNEPIELKTVNERDTFFKSLMLIVLNGTEHEFETPFSESAALKYEIHFETKIIYRENCEFSTEDIEKEIEASLDDVKE